MLSARVKSIVPLLCIIALSLMPMRLHASVADDKTIENHCMQSLISFMRYAENLYCDAGTNACGDSIGYFRANSAGESNEDGVRTNADIAMVMAFVAAEAEQGRARLPQTIDKERLKQMSIRALRYAVSTHRAISTATCTDGGQWGSSPTHHQWESSLWAMSVTLAWHFVGEWHSWCAADRESLCRLLRSEAQFLLGREVPTGFEGDTKAEENGWDSNLLASAVAFGDIGISPDSLQMALRRYSFNCYTVAADRQLHPELFVGANLYDDFTLQNHNYFHTSYQNVVMQELAESLLIINLLSPNTTQNLTTNTYHLTPNTHHPTPNTYTWHWQEVWNDVLSWLALADGELAMPNGNDWSMFLYDQLPAYAAMSTIMRNADALMLEKRCLHQLLIRQQTTTDGSYMLNADIGPRRMGVTAHRVLTTLLMHRLFTTADVHPSSWKDFCHRHTEARIFPCQNIVRGMSPTRFACFSASKGLANCSAVIVPNDVSECKIAIPYKEGFGGNLIGTPTGMPHIIEMNAREDGSWTVIGTADGEPFCIWATAGNAVIVIGRPAFLAIADDPFTDRVGRKATVSIGDRWANISNSIGIVAVGDTVTDFRTEDKGIVNSIRTRVIRADEACAAVYYCGISSRQTARLARLTTISRQSSPSSANSSKQSSEQTITLKTRDTDGSILTLTLVCDKENPRIITHTK